METIKLLPEEIQKLNELQIKSQSLAVKFGQIEMTYIQLNKAKEELIKELEKNSQEEQEIASQFQTKYGDGNINLSTGEFTPILKK